MLDALGNVLTGGGNIERRAIRRAGRDIDAAYGSAMDLARPMQERAQGDYMNLSRRYGEGAFRMPDQETYQGGSYQFNPQDVFNDPEYQAQMRAGTQAIDSSAAGRGMLFSGNTGRALQQAGQDLFARRSDELYRRGRGAFESDRDFGFTAANRAYDTNAANRMRDYSMGSELASYAPGALDRSINLGMGRAQAQADTRLGVAGARSNMYRDARSLGLQGLGRGAEALGNRLGLGG